MFEGSVFEKFFLDETKGLVTTGNPVQRLEEYAAKWQWTLSYNYSETNIKKQKLFCCSISCNKFPKKTFEGYGKKRRSSKRNAASAFLRLLIEGSEKDLLYESAQMGNCEDKPHHPETLLYEELYGPSDPRLLEFIKNLRCRKGRTLACIEVGSLLSRDGANFCQLLHEVAEEQNFEVSYREYRQRTEQGKVMCTVHINSNLLVFVGIACTPVEALKMAAKTALQMLENYSNNNL